jgi:hypothetical protein
MLTRLLTITLLSVAMTFGARHCHMMRQWLKAMRSCSSR